MTFASRLTRRQLLIYTSSLAAAGLISACSDDDGTTEADSEAGEASPTLVSNDGPPQPTTAETPAPGPPTTSEASEGSPVAGAGDVTQFLVLSNALTGFDDIDNIDLARVYMDQLGDAGDRLDELYEAVGIDDAGNAVTWQQVRESGALDDEGLRELANAIATSWYSGKYEQGDETFVATYINALAWQATEYRVTGPSTCAGAMGVWASPPTAA